MSWTSNGFFRNANILRLLTPASGNQLVDIYQPGTLNVASIVEGSRYSGFVTSLRLCVDISSVGEVDFPTFEPGMSDGEISALMAGLGAASPKKQLDILMRHSTQSPVKVASIQLFNRRPYYSIDLMLYLTDAPAFDVASDAVLSLQMVNVGFGLLSGTDTISVVGSAVEEAENTAPALNITVLGGGGGGGGSTPTNVITDSEGTIITTNEGIPVTL